jgi:sigma-B regulation protein RsbU (phosphoserine phosphatase)
MLEALDLNADKAPAEIIEGMQKALQDFMGDREQFDDITMLCIKYNGN